MKTLPAVDDAKGGLSPWVILEAELPRGFRGPGAKLQNKVSVSVIEASGKGKKARESEGTESGGTLRTL